MGFGSYFVSWLSSFLFSFQKYDSSDLCSGKISSKLPQGNAKQPINNPSRNYIDVREKIKFYNKKANQIETLYRRGTMKKCPSPGGKNYERTLG